VVVSERYELRFFLLAGRTPAGKEIHDDPTALEAGHLEACSRDRRNRAERRRGDPRCGLADEGRAGLLGCIAARREHRHQTGDHNQDT
jgi:hypothetical protein